MRAAAVALGANTEVIASVVAPAASRLAGVSSSDVDTVPAVGGAAANVDVVIDTAVVDGRGAEKY